MRAGLRAPASHSDDDSATDAEPGTIILDRDLGLVAATSAAWRWIGGSPHTVRDHLKSVFAKTGANCRRDLAATFTGQATVAR